jgi:phospholipid/cholesterol/gamma-HCH transport system substrate-binding protein
MEANARYSLVGAVVLIAGSLLVLGVLWLAGGGDRISYRFYTVYFVKQSMDGLDVESAVKLRGIKIGTVTAYSFVTRPAEAVRVTLRIDEDVPIRQGAQAYVKRSVVTGLATIEIANPATMAGLLEAAPAGERYPVIAEGSSDLDKVATALSNMAQSGSQVLDKINDLLSDQNRAAISQTVQNLRVLSDNLASNSANLAGAVQGIRDASDEFRFAGASIANAATRAEGSITSVGDNANQALQEASVVLRDMQMQTRDLGAQLQILVENGNIQLVDVSREVKTGASSLVTTGQRLSDPRGLLFGQSSIEPGPGEPSP